MSKNKPSHNQLTLKRIEQLENRTVLSGAAIVQPFANVDYFGHGTKDWAANAINAPEVWAQGYTGQDVTIAVIDTGVDVHHEDLAHNIWVNEGEIPANAIDDDGNGFVDDVYGWDFVDSDADVSDPSGHGTAVAGTMVAARDDNGVTGIAYDAQIMVIRVLAEDGIGSQLDISAGIRYAVANGADVINMSLGGTHSKRVSTAVNYAQNEGVLVVAAAGNSSIDLPDYPARYSAEFGNVISVGAHDSDFELATFSNTVGSTGSVQVDAPGYRVYSTLPEDLYQFVSGTSMAAPHVSAVAALALSANDSLAPAALRSMIVDGANHAVDFSDSLGGLNAATTVAFAAASLPQPEPAVPSEDETNTVTSNVAIQPKPSDPGTDTGDLPWVDAPEDIKDSPITDSPDDIVSPETDVPPTNDTPPQEVLIPEESVFALPGDVDGDGVVGFLDFLTISRNFATEVGEPGTKGDLDGDGVVDFEDFLAIARNYGRTLDELMADEETDVVGETMSGRLFED